MLWGGPGRSGWEDMGLLTPRGSLGEPGIQDPADRSPYLEEMGEVRGDTASRRSEDTRDRKGMSSSRRRT
jgi:hypothetical protein